MGRAQLVWALFWVWGFSTAQGPPLSPGLGVTAQGRKSNAGVWGICGVWEGLSGRRHLSYVPQSPRAPSPGGAELWSRVDRHLWVGFCSPVLYHLPIGQASEAGYARCCGFSALARGGKRDALRPRWSWPLPYTSSGGPWHLRWLQACPCPHPAAPSCSSEAWKGDQGANSFQTSQWTFCQDDGSSPPLPQFTLLAGSMGDLTVLPKREAAGGDGAVGPVALGLWAVGTRGQSWLPRA